MLTRLPPQPVNWEHQRTGPHAALVLSLTSVVVSEVLPSHKLSLCSPLPAELTFLWTYVAVIMSAILLAVSAEPCVLISIDLERMVCLNVAEPFVCLSCLSTHFYS